jgi:hypothetical protein
MNKLRYDEVELAIVKYFDKRKHIIIPNIYITYGTSCDHECDLLIIKKSGYSIEIEIKMSKSDMLADFKKKHNHKDQRIQKLYYAFPEEIYESCKGLVPDDCGIIEISRYNDKIYTTIRREIKSYPNTRKLSIEEQFKLTVCGVMRIWNLKEKLMNK